MTVCSGIRPKQMAGVQKAALESSASRWMRQGETMPQQRCADRRLTPLQCMKSWCFVL
jgi:hypothetical protein